MADETSSSGSAEEIAYKLFYYMRNLVPEKTVKQERMQANLDLFAECLKATKGLKHDTSKLT